MLQPNDDTDCNACDFVLVTLGVPIDLNHYDKQSINRKNLGGWTLLMYACNSGRLDLIDQLIAKGANLVARSDEGKTALMIAVAANEVRIAERVLAKEHLEATDLRGWTALFYAVRYGSEKCLKFLMDEGANVRALDNSGIDPITLALKYEMENMASLLQGGQVKLPIRIESPRTNIIAVKTPKKFATLNDMMQSRLTYTPNAKRSLPEEQEESTSNKKKVMLRTPVQSRTVFSPSQPTPGQFLTPRGMIKITPAKSQPKTPSILDFLAELQLEKYWPIFRDEEVDFETFITFDARNLKEIGITLYGPRMKIATAIKEYRSIHGIKSQLLKSPSWALRQ